MSVPASRSVCLWILFAPLLGGCPAPAVLEGDPPGNIIGADSSAGIGFGGGGSTQTAPSSVSAGVSQFDADLSRRFPGCEVPANLDAWRDEIMALVNAERRANGLNALRRNLTLERQATQYACEMIQFGFFAHDNPVTGSTLSERSDEFGYDFLVVGENLAAGQRTPQAAFNDWLDSPGHRQNILDPRFTELGVGIRTGGQYGIYWVQEFGQPLLAP